MTNPNLPATPSPETDTGAKTPFFDLATRWIVIPGLLLRLWHYGRNPSMWHDEAAATVNILNRSFTGFFGHLTHSATGSPLLFALVHCVVVVFGDSTYSLRLVSLLASCTGLVLMARLCRSLLEPADAIFAVAMVAFSDRLLWHAVEARHYSTDFLIGLLAVLLFARTMASSPGRRFAVFAIYAPFAILFSYPGIFLCAGVMMALLPRAWRDWNARTWAAWFALGAWVAALFAFFYLFMVRPQHSPDIDEAWVKLFPDLHKPWTVPFWFVGSTFSIFDYYVRPWLGGILLLPAIAGAVHWWKGEKRGLVILTLVAMGCAACAALIKSYPYTGARTMVYCMPGLVLLTGAGLGPFFRWTRRIFPDLFSVIPVIAIAAPVIISVFFAVWTVFVPWKRADTKGASAYVFAHMQAGDAITTNSYEYEYYFRKVPSFTPDIANATQFPTDNSSPRRLWMVLNAATADDRNKIANLVLSRGWHAEDEHEFQNASVYLLSSKPGN
ncbi:MAG TPA: glycosyltransferase family 39 protein [Chthoniobacteraceae bacterium]|nr:glycosyltransferase family 39 protein [Chthoniobacteraceae bacterium]